MNESTLVPREEMSDLDWLARNVHVWKGSERCVSACNGVVRWTVGIRPMDGLAWFTKHEWSSRRAELQNKPSWGDAPEWANFLSQGLSGTWFWHEFNPELGDCAYFSVKGKYTIHPSGETIGDWRDTLERRPDMHKNKEEIDTSSECVHKTEESVHISELEMLAKVSHLISDKRHRNQFEPFVSVEDAATAKQQAPKGSGKPILGMVLADLTNRALEGKEKYGEPLLAHNGRNPLWDAYQEALDLAMYLRQAIEEQSECW